MLIWSTGVSTRIFLRAHSQVGSPVLSIDPLHCQCRTQQVPTKLEIPLCKCSPSPAPKGQNLVSIKPKERRITLMQQQQIMERWNINVIINVNVDYIISRSKQRLRERRWRRIVGMNANMGLCQCPARGTESAARWEGIITQGPGKYIYDFLHFNVCALLYFSLKMTVLKTDKYSL